MEKIDLKFKYTSDEYSDAMRLHYSNIFNIKRDLIIALTMFVLGIADLLYFGYSILWALVTVLSIFLILMLLFAYFIIPAMVFKREIKLKDEYSLEFIDEGINFKTENINSRLEWKIYKKVIENEQFFLLYWGKYTFTVIPKRAFQNQEGENIFKNLIKEKISSYSNPQKNKP